MRRRILILTGLIGLAILSVLWWQTSRAPRTEREVASENPAASASVRKPQVSETVASAAQASDFLVRQNPERNRTNLLTYRLSNTREPLKQLERDTHAILLENALIDTRQPVNFQVPASLQSSGDPGSYVVQAAGTVDDAFRARLSAAGAEFVSYIPNNAYLVRASAAVANQLQTQTGIQAVLPFAPIYKLKSELLAYALDAEPLPEGARLNVLMFAGAEAEVRELLRARDIAILAEERSPFGSVATVAAEADWLALARSPGVQLLELAYARKPANDLSRARLGVAEDSVTETNYFGLTGQGVRVGVNDFGVDATHPDLLNRVEGAGPGGLVDTSGHGTHVAGSIAGSGAMSLTVSNAFGSVNPATTNQLRGMAPEAELFSQSVAAASDAELQQGTAGTNIFISNNSWGYNGDHSYSLAAASYDAAVRDALPGVTGSQPVLFVFAAGNDGNGNDNGLGGRAGTIWSPATAKNVLTVGAIELARDITNEVNKITTTGDVTTTNTTTPWKEMTSSENQVARFSSRGNVGVGIEGESGRVKPDVVAPGTFVISARSSQWDEPEYYNPTNYHSTALTDQSLPGGTGRDYFLFLPVNAVGLSIFVSPNLDSPTPFPDLPIYVRKDGLATPGNNDLTRTNSISIPPDLPDLGGAVGQNWSYHIVNTTSNTVAFDLHTIIVTTNDLGDYYQVLSNLNNSITSTNGEGPHYYRYESGTSMAAAHASGTLALMQGFFEQNLHRTNSPALMKALLINGARSVGSLYSFQTQNSITYQGWGAIQLNNTLPPGITNAFTLDQPNSVLAFDQSSADALATGQSVTRFVSLDEDGRFLSLRVTLAWTDPAGNPMAGIKLVNNLDLIVTNLDTGDIYLGNDFMSGSLYTAPWDTNDPPNFDVINNVENVYLRPELGTNYSITVMARAINVNAVTAHPNDTVQDYALVISSGEGEWPTSLTLDAGRTLLSVAPPVVTYVSNSLNVATFSSGTLVGQHVGANTPLLGTSSGMTNQWRFYTMSNNTSFTNASFLISQQRDLATPRMGVFSAVEGEATRRYADLDLYVSTNAALTNLDPGALAAAEVSLSRNDLSGDEFVTYSNSTMGAIYYIGVKSEDQQAAEFELWGIFSELPLGAEDGNGFVTAYPMLGYDIPDGSPSLPRGTRFVAITRASLTGVNESIRRVLITNNVTHERYGDVIATVDHNLRAVTFDNHRSVPNPPYNDPPGPYAFLYDDSGEGDFLDSVPPSGPGTFEDFMGEAPGGTWYFTYSDDALTQTGRVNTVAIRLDRQCEDDCDITNTVAGLGWRHFSRNVPVEATNLTICVDIITANNPKPLEIYVRKDRRPTREAYDFKKTVVPPGGCLTIDNTSLPPLSAGRYFISVYNPNNTSQTFVYRSTILLGPPPQSIPVGLSGKQSLLDDAVTNYSIFITNTLPVAEMDVALRLDHPRVSDLSLTLISPKGTRVLLAENRGGLSADGFGSTLAVTNFVPVAANGGPTSNSVPIDTGAVSGKMTIEYDFFQLPDQLTAYYEGVQIFNSGMVSGTGQVTLSYGPGHSTFVEIRMNEFGNAETNTLWEYSVSSIGSMHSYLIFTDNTNKTTLPIKFAPPPFRGLAGANYVLSDFEFPTLAQDYAAPTVGVPDGWNVVDETVTVTTNSAYAGTNSLALRAGQINRTMVTTPGRSYQLGYAYRKAPTLDGIISWWPGDGNTLDIVGGNHAVVRGGVTYGTGLVGQGFNFDGNSGSYLEIANSPSLNLLNEFSIELWYQDTNPSLYDYGLIAKRGISTIPCNYGINVVLSGIGPYYNDPNYAGVGDDPGTYEASRYQPVPSKNTFHHLATTFRQLPGNSIELMTYLDGVSVRTRTIPGNLAATLNSASLIIGASSPEGEFFRGIIDEATLYGRVLSAAEIQAIYDAGAAGKCGMTFPPTVCAPSLGAQIYIPNADTNTFTGGSNWRLGGLFFTATSNLTTVHLGPVETNSSAEVLMDHFTVTEAGDSLYVLPEESLKVLEGESAYGLWQLEILDSRTGATNNVALLDWQLQFILQTNTPAPRILRPGDPLEQEIPAGRIIYYAVDVPPFARYATNVLFRATPGLNFYFNQTAPPASGATNVNDVVFALNAANHTEVLSAPSIVPPTSTKANLLPGERYYLAVENPNPVNATYIIYVDFDLATFPPTVELTNAIPYCTVNPLPFSLDYYHYSVSAGAVRAQFELRDLSGDMTLVLRRELPPTLAVFDYLSANVYTNDEIITVFDFSQPVPLTPGDWYFAAANLSPGPVSYCAAVREWNMYGTNIVITNAFLGSNSFCLTWTSLDGAPYFVEGVTNLPSSDWVAVSPTVYGTGAATTYCVPLPSPYHFFRVREGQALSTYVPPPVILRILKRFNGVEITWSGPPGQQYQVEWSSQLAPPVWTAFPEIVTSATGIYQYLDDGTQTGSFNTVYYRLVLLP